MEEGQRGGVTNLLSLAGLAEGDHDVLRQLHILEHALQFRGEAAAALGLELGDHRLLGVDRRTLAQEESLGEILLVEGLEHVFAVDKPEQHHDPIHQRFELLLGSRFVASLQHRTRL